MEYGGACPVCMLSVAAQGLTDKVGELGPLMCAGSYCHPFLTLS